MEIFKVNLFTYQLNYQNNFDYLTERLLNDNNPNKLLINLNSQDHKEFSKFLEMNFALGDRSLVLC